MTKLFNKEELERLAGFGLEAFGNQKRLPMDLEFEAPCGIKFCDLQQEVKIGAFSYVVSGYLCGVQIGRYCSFGENVQIGRQSHPVDWLSTSPFLYLKSKDVLSYIDFQETVAINAVQSLPIAPTRLKKIEIGNDVWIGQNALVLPGVKIGNGAIIAAGSVVSKDVMPYSVVGGNPAKFIKFRVLLSLIPKLEQLQWWNYSPEVLNQFPVWSPRDFISKFKSAKLSLPVYETETKKLSNLFS